MAKCTECGRPAGFMMSVCASCIAAQTKNVVTEVATEREAATERHRRTQERVSGVLLATTERIEGFDIDRTIEVISAECALGVNALKDIMVGARDVFGGRSETLQNAMREAHEILLRQLRHEAVAHGGNGVVGIKITFSTIGGATSTMLVASALGTAVILKPVRRSAASTP